MEKVNSVLSAYEDATREKNSPNHRHTHTRVLGKSKSPCSGDGCVRGLFGLHGTVWGFRVKCEGARCWRVGPERSAAPSGGRQPRGVREAGPRPQTTRHSPALGLDPTSGATAALRVHAAPPPARLCWALPSAAVFSRLRLRPNFQATVSRRRRAGGAVPTTAAGRLLSPA